MSEFYFDVGKWEEDLAKRGGSIRAEEGDEEGGSGKKRKRPSKKDLVSCIMAIHDLLILISTWQERFKEQKKQKKIAKTAWLRTWHLSSMFYSNAYALSLFPNHWRSPWAQWELTPQAPELSEMSFSSSVFGSFQNFRPMFEMVFKGVIPPLLNSSGMLTRGHRTN